MKHHWMTILTVAGLTAQLWAGGAGEEPADANENKPVQPPKEIPALVKCGTGLEEPVLRPVPIDPDRPIILPIDPIPPAQPVEPGPPTRIIEKPDQGNGQADSAEAKLWQDLNQSELVMVVTVARTEMLMTTMSMPPRYGMQFSVDKDAKLLRGKVEGKVEDIDFRYMTLDRDSLPSVGDKLVLAVSTQAHAGGTMHVIEGLYRGDDDTLKLAEKATSLPVGWKLNQEGKPVSPWAEVEGFKWPRHYNNWIKDRMRRVTCAVTNRPVLAMPEGVTFEVEQIIPEDARQYVNTYGDGKFKITLKNTTDKKLQVPAVLAIQNDPNLVLVDESLVVLHKGKPVFRPQTDWFDVRTQKLEMFQGPTPVEIEPGKSFSFELNTLELQGIDWPRGGSRVQFTFALGDQAQTNFFYYFSKHHDKLLPKKPQENDELEPDPAMGD